MLYLWDRQLFGSSTATGLLLLLMMALVSQRTSFAACIGDCSGDAAVNVAELLQGVNIALGNAPVSTCTAVDANGDGEVAINELVAAVNAALNGCPVNHAPDVPCFDVYQGYVGSQMQLPIDAADPDNDHLLYASDSLPDSAALDAQTGIFNWTPTPEQFGTFYVPFTVTDDGTPPLSMDGLLTFRVSQQDLCQQVTCDPATGCQSTPIALSQPCCTKEPGDEPGRMTEPLVSCPQGLVLFVGRNTGSGIGRLQDCDELAVINSAQTAASVRLNIQARCVNASAPAILHVRLEAQTRLAFDSMVPILLDPGSNGYVQRLSVTFPVTAAGPFYDLQTGDADLTATLTDVDGVAVTTHVRPKLTCANLTDLTDLDAASPGGEVSCP